MRPSLLLVTIALGCAHGNPPSEAAEVAPGILIEYMSAQPAFAGKTVVKIQLDNAQSLERSTSLNGVDLVAMCADGKSAPLDSLSVGVQKPMLVAPKSSTVDLLFDGCDGHVTGLLLAKVAVKQRVGS